MSARTLPMLVTLAALLCASLGLSQAATAQGLEDTWFKVTVNLKGAAVMPNEEVEKIKGKVVCYVNFTPPELDGGADGVPSNLYDYQVISEIAPGNWQPSSVGSVRTAGDAEQVLFGSNIGSASNGIKWQVVVPDEDTTTLQVMFVARLKLAYDKQGALKKASFKSSGGYIPWGDGGGDVLAGSAKVKGVLVPIEKLPFPPE